MVTIKYLGPAEKAQWRIRGETYQFDRGESKSVPDEVADYLLGRNPDEHDMEQASIYGTPVFVVAGGGEPE